MKNKQKKIIRMNISKEEKKKWILENCIDKNGNIDLTNLDFSDFHGDFILSGTNLGDHSVDLSNIKCSYVRNVGQRGTKIKVSPSNCNEKDRYHLFPLLKSYLNKL